MKKLHKGFYSHKGFIVATDGVTWRATKNKTVIVGNSKKEVYSKIEAALHGALQFTQITTANGYTVYKFTDRGVSFEVLTDDGITYQVWCERAGNCTPPTCYDSLAHLATRSKTFSNFAALIAA